MERVRRRFQRFITEMDAKAWTSLGVSLALLALVVAMFVWGRDWLRLDDRGELRKIFAWAADSHTAFLGVILLYGVLATTGFPQMLLFMATIYAFGWRVGALYAWIGTMMSALMTFYLGRFMGRDWVQRFGGERVRQSMAFVGRHGIVASGLIRLIPSAPFIVVNAAAGAAGVPVWKFVLGTSIGIIPKIALVAAIGAVAPDAADLEKGLAGLSAYFKSRSALDISLIVLIIPAWAGLLLAARAWYLRMRRREENN